jgi:SiaC family regulatory phosphoprotein
MLHTLAIRATDETPKVEFNVKPFFFLMEGISIPENVLEFYEPILVWYEKFVEANQKDAPPFEMLFRINFLRFMLKIADLSRQVGHGLHLTWEIEDEDDEELVDWVNFVSSCIDVPININYVKQ